MGRENHIERPGAPISLGEWIEAVQSIPGLRLCSDHVLARNPRTGAEVRVPGNDGDVQMFFPKEKIWFPVFHWRRRISFKATGNASVLAAALELASKLKAQVVDDEGNAVT